MKSKYKKDRVTIFNSLETRKENKQENHPHYTSTLVREQVTVKECNTSICVVLCKNNISQQLSYQD